MLAFEIIVLALVASHISAEPCENEQLKECSNLPSTEGQTFDQETDWEKATSVYQFYANDIHGKNVSLDKYRDHVLIIVNVASHCGLTDANYKQLQALYEKYADTKGLRILAFPSNQFAAQEPGTSAEILEFVKKYNVSFDMYEKIDVNGEDAHPLWKWLKNNASGFINDEIKWNFSKFIIGKDGRVVSRHSPMTEPLSLEDSLLAQF